MFRPVNHCEQVQNHRFCYGFLTKNGRVSERELRLSERNHNLTSEQRAGQVAGGQVRTSQQASSPATLDDSKTHCNTSRPLPKPSSPRRDAVQPDPALAPATTSIHLPAAGRHRQNRQQEAYDITMASAEALTRKGFSRRNTPHCVNG